MFEAVALFLKATHLCKKRPFLSCSQSKAVWHHHADGMAKAVTEMPKETL